jgi:hypothetical protein
MPAAPQAGTGSAATPPTGPIQPAALTLWGSIEFGVNGQDVSGHRRPTSAWHDRVREVCLRVLRVAAARPPRGRDSNLSAVTAPGALLKRLVSCQWGRAICRSRRTGRSRIKGVVARDLSHVADAPQRLFRSRFPEPDGGASSPSCLNGRDVADLPVQIRPAYDVNRRHRDDDRSDDWKWPVRCSTNWIGRRLDFRYVIFADRAYWPRSGRRAGA